MRRPGSAGGDEPWARDDLELGQQLLASARLNGSQFTELFNATFLGHRPEGIANLHALLWGVTAGVLRAGRRGRRRSEAEVEQLADLVASAADPGLFDAGRGRADFGLTVVILASCIAAGQA